MKINNKIYIYKEKTGQKDYLIAISKYNNTMFNIASFENLEQFKIFMQTLDFKIKLLEVVNGDTQKEIQIYTSNYKIIDSSFWNLEELPKRAKPLKALSNGSIVTCYYCKNYKENTITIYRPNPNAKTVYKPLELQEHIAHKKIYGTY